MVLIILKLKWKWENVSFVKIVHRSLLIFKRFDFYQNLFGCWAIYNIIDKIYLIKLNSSISDKISDKNFLKKF